MANVLFKKGTKAQYDALAVKDSNTLYWLYDVLELRKGEDLYGKGTEATSLASGLMSAADKAKLDSLSTDGITAGLSPVDNSVVIADGEDGKKTIGVRVSAAEGNALEIKDDGLFVTAVGPAGETVEFTIERQAAAADGFNATYKLKRTAGDEATYVGDEINIPKSMAFQSGSLKTVETANSPYDGAAVGDPYIDLVLSNADNTHIYIPVKDLVSSANAGDGIDVTNNTVSIKLDAANANGLTVGPDGLSIAVATASAAGAMSAADKTALDTVVACVTWGDLSVG